LAWCANLPISGSRADALFGNVLVFNHTVFEETKSHWTGDIVDIKMAANARAGRIKTSQATNPTYEMSDLGNAFTFGESAAYVVFLGDQKGSANRTWLEFWFGKSPSNNKTQRGPANHDCVAQRNRAAAYPPRLAETACAVCPG
jgi:hypothetical protein